MNNIPLKVWSHNSLNQFPFNVDDLEDNLLSTAFIDLLADML